MEYYPKYASLEEGRGTLDYDVYLNTTAYAWSVYSKENNMDPVDILQPKAATIWRPTVLGILPSYINYLIDQQGYSLIGLIRSMEAGESSKDANSYMLDLLE